MSAEIKSRFPGILCRGARAGRKRSNPAVCALIAATCLSQAAYAELSVAPVLESGVRYDTNPRFRNKDLGADSATGTTFDVRIPIEYRAPRWSTSLDPRVLYSFYAGNDDDLEDRDHYLPGATTWVSPRSSLGASYGYSELSFRTSEFGTAGDTTAGGSGQVQSVRDDSQQRWYFQPYWQYRLTPADSFTVRGGYEEVRYDQTAESRRFDYDFASASISANHAFNPRHSLSLQASLTRFDSGNDDLRITNDSETKSLSLIYTYAWTETTELSADIGWASTKSAVSRPNAFSVATGPFCNPILIPFLPCESKSDAANVVGNLSATKRSETVKYDIVIGQSITPNSDGAEVLRLNLNASASKTFSKRISGSIGILVFRQDSLGRTQADLERDYFRGNARLNYKLGRNWSISGAYAYTLNEEQAAIASGRKIGNHLVSASVIYSTDGWRW